MTDNWMFGQPTIILISGKSGAGKTTGALFLENKLKELSGVMVIRTSFAKSVKEIAKLCFGWDGIKDLKGRKLLQNIGNAGREYDKDLWVKRVVDDISSFGVPPNITIIDDWRFLNEAEFLEKCGFKVYKIRIISHRLNELIDKNDISETSLDNYDGFNFEILNNKSMKEFEILLDLVYQIILKEESNG